MTTSVAALLRAWPAATVLGVRIHPLSMRQVVALVGLAIERRERLIVANVNVHAMNLACEQPWFRDMLNQSDLVFCDGFGVKWGARMLGQSLPHRFTPPDWLDCLATMAARHGYRMALVGARPGVAEQTAPRLQAHAPGLEVVATHHGFFDPTPGSADNEALLARLNAAQPDILLVGMGMPRQERWLLDTWPRLNARVALPVGAAFDYLGGTVRRGPRWMTDHGFEWLARLLIEPRRLWHRYLVGNPLFVWRVVRARIGV